MHTLEKGKRYGTNRYFWYRILNNSIVSNGDVFFLMSSIINKYLKKNNIIKQWPLQGSIITNTPSCIVIIPSLAEHSCLFPTLSALSESIKSPQIQPQVIVVVNNRRTVTVEERTDNTHTLDALKKYDERPAKFRFHLTWVDASSSGNELPDKEGVGLARRIGADHGVQLLADPENTELPIVHLDADSPPAPGYLDALHHFYTSSLRWGGYTSYEHPIVDTDSAEGSAMITYENYMRYHELALRYAKSPYAYPALGSIMSSTARAYVSAGGMNRRCAGEDFYFMQQLAKTGKLERIPNALVYPSSRSSYRTPFGTGRSILKSMQSPSPHMFLFHPESYKILRCWLKLIKMDIMQSSILILEKAGGIHPELKSFLKQRKFISSWDKITSNHFGADARLQQFHIWFDGLRTIQLIHHLRDTAFPNVIASDAIQTVYEWYNCPITTNADDDPVAHLHKMRRLCQTKAH